MQNSGESANTRRQSRRKMQKYKLVIQARGGKTKDSGEQKGKNTIFRRCKYNYRRQFRRSNTRLRPASDQLQAASTAQTQAAPESSVVMRRAKLYDRLRA